MSKDIWIAEREELASAIDETILQRGDTLTVADVADLLRDMADGMGRE